MRKYIMNSAIIGAVFGGYQTLQATRKGPHDWRLVFIWISWIATLALAIGSVADEANDSPAEKKAKKLSDGRK
ncbi:hypothetical protein [Labedella endophytica]|uniref:Uncharacterized protein n=1 Tax=Labedella endophytica TaxID=1523160 RepID=A0A3S0VDR6_9MICO|nr:hypothetical protein [Labedella endophytica]RUQ97636.1 hypothetical protein ELQ94_15890 [Labedella endophytica]